MSSSFVVPSGPCKGSFDRVVVSTDLEPDDAVALLALAPRLQGVPLLVVLGEGPIDKRAMAGAMLTLFGLDATSTIVQGGKSKADWPPAVSSVYGAPAACAATVSEAEGAEPVAEVVKEFLSGAAKPFALLLKPPREFALVPEALCQKCVAALYGSFNLSELRDHFKETEKLSDAGAHERQNALLSSFASLLWIERSFSVGRDSVLTDSASPAVWKAVDAQPQVLQHVLQWNAQTLRTMARKLADFEKDVTSVLPSATSTEPIGIAQYKAVAGSVEKAEKRVAVLKSITATSGRQVCHADTLVVACLLDDGGRLLPWLKCGHAGVDGLNKPTFTPADAGATTPLWALVAEPGPSRAELTQTSLELLGTALPMNIT